MEKVFIFFSPSNNGCFRRDATEFGAKWHPTLKCWYCEIEQRNEMIEKVAKYYAINYHAPVETRMLSVFDVKKAWDKSIDYFWSQLNVKNFK